MDEAASIAEPPGDAQKRRFSSGWDSWEAQQGRRAGSKHQQAGTWLALLGLASMPSPGAFADYISVDGIWLLTLLNFKGEKKRWQLLLLGSWIFMFFLPGIYPLPSVLPSPVISLSFVEVFFLIALFVCVILRPEPRDQSPAAFV